MSHDNISMASSFGGDFPRTRKPRVSLACKRCKRRKQKCDGANPTCKSCERVGTECIYEKAIRPQYPGGKTQYINVLEERIALLESRLPAFAEDHFGKAMNNRMGNEQPINSNTTYSRPQLDSASSSHDSISDDTEGENNSLVDGVAYLSLCASGTADTIPDPAYLGSSSGATIARMIQASLFRRSSGSSIHGIGSLRWRNGGCQQLPPEPPITKLDETPFPHPDEAKLLFDTFFNCLHTRWPLLDRKMYTTLFEQQYIDGALSTMHRSMMHLIYAIASRFLQLTKMSHNIDPEEHLVAAIEPMEHILEQHNLGTVQFLLLLALHGQRSPYGAGAWSQVRYAVSLCIELGLHRERRSYSIKYNTRDIELRRRTFWCCYCLDRATSTVLGRAFAISDRDINVKMPDPSVIFWDLTHGEGPDTSQSTPWSNIEPFIHIIKLERLQSRIHQTVLRVDKDFLGGPPEEKLKRDKKMEVIQSELENWLEKIPHPPKDSKKISWMYDPESANHDSQDFFNLQYHKALLALFSVLLPTLEPTDSKFFMCARSAACVCVAYKRLNQQKTLSYTMISLHSCFVAGLTVIYCLWRNPGLFGYDILEATQACSQSLTIFGEKWAGAVKYRDIFDTLSGNLVKTIVGSKGLGSSLTMDSGSIFSRPSAGSEARIDHSTSSGSEFHEKQSDLMTESHMSQIISDAVEEAFMEVDEEAPGGWQGWRMWTDMMGSGSTAVRNETDTDWDYQTGQVPRNGSFAGNEWHFEGVGSF